MESNYDTTFTSDMAHYRATKNGYALLKAPHGGLYVKVQADIDPIAPGTVLKVTNEELEALRYRRITIGGILELRYQQELNRARLEQMKEMERARAELEAERNKPISVKMIIDKNKTTFIYSSSHIPLLPGNYKIEIKEVEIL